MFQTTSLYLALFGSLSVADDIHDVLAPGSSVTSNGAVFLIKGEIAPSPTGENSWVLNGKTTNVNDMQFGLQFRAFASSKCGAIESFNATFDGYRIKEQSDIVFTVSAGDKYFSVFTDWDGNIHMGDTDNKGGIFTYPDCKRSRTSLPSLGENEENANSLFKGVTWSDYYLDNWYTLRDRLCGGDNFGCPRQTSDRVGYNRPFTISIDNDILSNELTFGFDAGDFSYKCTFGDSFDENTDIQINLTPDWDNEEWGIEKITFIAQCDDKFPIWPQDVPFTNEECAAYGDPHIMTWDGTGYHFQGEGYFDYVKSCLCNDNYLPFKISAKQVYCGEPYTCVGETIITIDDGSIISIPSHGDNITPIFVNDNNKGQSAIGTKSFLDMNGNWVRYSVEETLFEIEYYYNDEYAKMQVYYAHDILRIKTTDSMIGNNTMCGLCGNYNNNDVDDFIKCNSNECETVSTKDVIKYWLSLETDNDAYARTNIFGESCCNKDYDLKFLGKSDCTRATPAPTFDDPCFIRAEEYCSAVYDEYCHDCYNETRVNEPKFFSEWISGCVLDFCAINRCNKLALKDDYNPLKAIRSGCVNNVVRECIVEKFTDFYGRFKFC